jgi:hypothetical protein
MLQPRSAKVAPWPSWLPAVDMQEQVLYNCQATLRYYAEPRGDLPWQPYATGTVTATGLQVFTMPFRIAAHCAPVPCSLQFPLCHLMRSSDISLSMGVQTQWRDILQVSLCAPTAPYLASMAAELTLEAPGAAPAAPEAFFATFLGRKETPTDEGPFEATEIVQLPQPLPWRAVLRGRIIMAWRIQDAGEDLLQRRLQRPFRARSTMPSWRMPQSGLASVLEEVSSEEEMDMLAALEAIEYIG